MNYSKQCSKVLNCKWIVLLWSCIAHIFITWSSRWKRGIWFVFSYFVSSAASHPILFRRTL